MFCRVDVFPFPNVQFQLIAEESGTDKNALKVAITGVHPFNAFVKSAWGEATIFTGTGKVVESLQPLLVTTISCGKYWPGAA